MVAVFGTMRGQSSTIEFNNVNTDKCHVDTIEISLDSLLKGFHSLEILGLPQSLPEDGGTNILCDSHYDSYISNGLNPDDNPPVSMYLTDNYYYNWHDIAIAISKLLKKNGMYEYGVDRLLCICSMIDPLKTLNCEQGDTLYFIESIDLQETFYLRFWVNSNISKKQCYQTEWTKTHSPILNEYTSSLVDYQDKLILKWNKDRLIEESNFINKWFPTINKLPTRSVFRIILKERTRFIIDFFKYDGYITLEKDYIEDYKQDYVPFPEIPSQYIH